MFEKWRIKQHMEVTDSLGAHVGTVDEVEETSLKLTRTDSPDGSHHSLDFASVDRVVDNRVYLKRGTPLPFMRGTAQPATPGVGTGDDAATGDPAVDAGYAGSVESSAPSTDMPIFGTSGHGTGSGGSGLV